MSTESQEIDGQAAEWAVKRDLGGLTSEEQAEFEAWLAADVRHLGAYGRAEAVMVRLERIHKDAVTELRVHGPGRTPSWLRRRDVMAGGIAASVAVVGLAGTAFWRSDTEEIFATQLGQVSEFVLGDGSIVTLNTDSRLAVNFTKKKRAVSLLQGEALFDVAKDKKRPFIVSAGHMLARAVGTSFAVSMLPLHSVQVLVREGVVEVSRTGIAAGTPIRITANTQVLAPHDAPIVAKAVPQARLARDMAWQYGRIAFDNQTLGDAAAEFARYSNVRIVVAPAVANRTVTGLFVSNDPVGFARAAAAVLGLRVEVSDREVQLSDKS
jgi:transmembrane sensor